MRSLLRRYDRFIDLCGQAPGYIVAWIALAVFAEVAARNLGLGALPGVFEAVEYSLVAMTFLGTTWLFRAQRHVRVEILVTILPDGLRRLVETATRLVVLAVTLAMTWAAGQAALLAWSDGSVIRRMLTVPEWLPIGVTAFGFALLALEALRQLLGDREETRSEAEQAAAMPLDPERAS